MKKYKSALDLEKVLSGIIDDKKKLIRLKNEAIKNSEEFSLEKLQKYFKKEILEKMDEL